MSTHPTNIRPDDFNKTHLDILAALAGDVRSGSEIRSRLEQYYGAEISHDRLYRNVDELDEMGLLEKRQRAIDNRTNAHELTNSGENLLKARATWLSNSIRREL